jgi:hypothetical protein
LPADAELGCNAIVAKCLTDHLQIYRR